MRFVDLGMIDFRKALQKQEETVCGIVRQHCPETVYLVEHPHVFTVGRTGNSENLLVERDWEGRVIELIRINRGGDITYHGPGQLVGYLHLDLRRRGCDVHGYLRGLEECLIRTIRRFGIRAFRRAHLTGVWTKKGKLASIGVGVRRWITMHGFALNLDPELRYFQLIHPCGVVNCPVTSFRAITGDPINVGDVKAVFRKNVRDVFSISNDE